MNMAPSQGEIPPLPASAEEVKDMDSYMEVVRKLTTCITNAVNEGKSVTAANKRLISLASEEIRSASRVFCLLNPAVIPGTPAPNNELKEEILACVREEIAGVKKLVSINRPSYAQAAAAARGTMAPAGLTAPRSSPPVTKPAIIVSPTIDVKTRQEAVELFKKSINYRTANYAPARIQPVSNNKLRVEFDTETQLKDTLMRLQGKSDVRAEPVRKLRPMVILKGISKDVSADDLIQTISRQNSALTELINDGNGENLKLRFKRDNKNTNLYNAVFLVEPKLYSKMLDMGRISVDYQRVHVAAFSPFLQCHKCLQFGHTKLRCTANESPCSHCASTEHDVGKCPNKDRPNSTKCINCHTHNTRFNTKLDTKHTANSNNCPRLRAMREKINNRIDYGYAS